MPLHVELSEVKTPDTFKGGKFPSWKDLLKEPTGWESATYDPPLFVTRMVFHWTRRTTERGQYYR